MKEWDPELGGSDIRSGRNWWEVEKGWELVGIDYSSGAELDEIGNLLARRSSRSLLRGVKLVI